MELSITMLMAVLIAALCVLIAALYKHIDRLKASIADLKLDHAELVKQHFMLEEDVEELKQLLPRDNKGEIARHELLLKQLNDEMEQSLRMEQDWNKGLQGILNYGKPIAGEDKT